MASLSAVIRAHECPPQYLLSIGKQYQQSHWLVNIYLFEMLPLQTCGLRLTRDPESGSFLQMKFPLTSPHRPNVRFAAGNKSFDCCDVSSLDCTFPMYLLFAGVCVSHLLHSATLEQVTLWSLPSATPPAGADGIERADLELQWVLWDLARMLYSKTVRQPFGNRAEFILSTLQLRLCADLNSLLCVWVSLYLAC